jgi:DNA-binding response OmpR family regulator
MLPVVPKPNEPMPPFRKRLLFVDDEPGIRHTLPLILRRYGFTVMVAGTVAEALAEIKAQPVDLLLCDLNLEREHDGFDVVRAARSVNPDVVVIILTAYPDVDSAIQGIREQVDDYVVKPSNPDTLVAVLANNLAKKTGQNVIIQQPIKPPSDAVQ